MNERGKVQRKALKRINKGFQKGSEKGLCLLNVKPLCVNQLYGAWCCGSGGSLRVATGPVANNPQGSNQTSFGSFATPDSKPRLDGHLRHINKKSFLYLHSLKLQM